MYNSKYEGGIGMEQLKKIIVNDQKVEKISLYISKLIDELKEQDNAYFIEGVYGIGTNFFGRPGLNLVIVCNDYKFNLNFAKRLKNVDRRLVNLEKKYSFGIKIETFMYDTYFRKKLQSTRSDYPYEFMLRYGKIFYDQNGKLESLQNELKTDDDLAWYLDYWKDACELVPPVQYTKKKM